MTVGGMFFVQTSVLSRDRGLPRVGNPGIKRVSRRPGIWGQFSREIPGSILKLKKIYKYLITKGY